MGGGGGRGGGWQEQKEESFRPEAYKLCTETNTVQQNREKSVTYRYTTIRKNQKLTVQNEVSKYISKSFCFSRAVLDQNYSFHIKNEFHFFRLTDKCNVLRGDYDQCP